MMSGRAIPHKAIRYRGNIGLISNSANCGRTPLSSLRLVIYGNSCCGVTGVKANLLLDKLVAILGIPVDPGNILDVSFRCVQVDPVALALVGTGVDAVRDLQVLRIDGLWREVPVAFKHLNRFIGLTRGDHLASGS